MPKVKSRIEVPEPPKAEKPKGAKSKKVLPTSNKSVLNVAALKYPQKSTEICEGETAMTQEKMKELLGWEAEPEVGEKFGDEYLFKDLTGRKIRCNNNLRNRPLYMGLVDAYIQEHLRRRWRFNGEPIIIGTGGQVLNGQHTLISGVMAEQHRVGEQKLYWSDFWKTEVTVEKLIVYGVEPTDEVINTMDTCKPRSIADVIYRSEYFTGMKGKDRRVVSRMADYAIRTMWERTWAKDNPFANIRTHSETLDYLNRHPKLLECIAHIFQEYNVNKDWENNTKRFGAGYASAYLYLMGSSRSELEAHRDADGVMGEAKLDWTYWEQACRFWSYLANVKEKSFQPLRNAFAALNDSQTGTGATRQAKETLICKAWSVFITGQKLTEQNLKLKTRQDDEGHYELVEFLTTGGIDRGVKIKDKKPDPKNDAKGIPTESEVKKTAAQIKQENLKAMSEEEKEKRRELNKAKLLAEREARKSKEAVEAGGGKPTNSNDLLPPLEEEIEPGPTSEEEGAEEETPEPEPVKETKPIRHKKPIVRKS